MLELSLDPISTRRKVYARQSDVTVRIKQSKINTAKKCCLKFIYFCNDKNTKKNYNSFYNWLCDL